MKLILQLNTVLSYTPIIQLLAIYSEYIPRIYTLITTLSERCARMVLGAKRSIALVVVDRNNSSAFIGSVKSSKSDYIYVFDFTNANQILSHCAKQGITTLLLLAKHYYRT